MYKCSYLQCTWWVVYNTFYIQIITDFTIRVLYFVYESFWMTVVAGQYLVGWTGTKRESVNCRERRTNLNGKYNIACARLEDTNCNLKGIKTFM